MVAGAEFERVFKEYSKSIQRVFKEYSKSIQRVFERVFGRVVE